MNPKPIPDNYCATPYLICRRASEALQWYSTAFEATKVVCLQDPSGKVMHAEIRIGKSPIMVADEFPDMGYSSPESIGGSPVSIYVYVEDADRVFAHALETGATEVMAMSDQFDGDRRGTIKDPYGHIWLIATKREAVPVAEMKRRFEQMMKGEA